MDDEHTRRDADPASGSPAEESTKAPRTLGRYTVIERVGRGGMGVVFSAFDAELDRRVAIKVLRSDRGSDNAKLRREAEAMAMVSHPNVVRIYDVGEHEGKVFLAMEFVDPPTLAQWLAEAERPWVQLRKVFAEAGQGLLAAHEASMVHGDFKPQNVLLGEPMRARVTDFGLARPDPTTQVGRSSATTSTAPRAKTYARGTPAFMAPEILGGAEPSPASDQFAFAVCLFEAAYGRHPFCDHGEPLQLRVERMHAAELRAPPGDRDVPRWVLVMLRRALARSPRDRFPSMEPLLEVLSHGPNPTRRRVWIAMAVLGALGITAGVDLVRDHRARLACLDAADRGLTEVWNDDVRRALGRRFEATGVGRGDTLGLTTQRVDAFVADWVGTQREVCSDEAEGGPSPIVEARRDCLDRGRAALRSTLGSLTAEDAERSVLWKAPAMMHGLPAPGRCDRARAENPIGRGPPRSAVDELAEIQAAEDAGSPARAAELADALVERAASAGDRRARLHGLARRGGLYSRLRRSEDAVRDLTEAYFEALQEGEALVAFDAACDLVFVHGVVLGQAEEGRAWARHAEALREVTADTSPRSRARLQSSLAMLEFSAEHYDEAREHYLRALDLREAADGPNASGVAQIHNNLGVLEGKRSNLDRAQRHFERALSIRRAVLGMKHPALATTMLNVGTALARRHATMPAALETIDEAVEILEQHEGSNPFALATAYAIRTGTLLGLRRGQEAEASARRTLELHEVAGAPPLGFARARRELGQAIALQGRAGEAEAMLRRAKSELGEARGETGEAEGRLALGIFLVEQERHEEARAELRPLLEQLETQPSADTRGLVMVEYATATAALEGPAAALEMLREGTELLEAGEQRPHRVARARALLEQLEQLESRRSAP